MCMDEAPPAADLIEHAEDEEWDLVGSLVDLDARCDPAGRPTRRDAGDARHDLRLALPPGPRLRVDRTARGALAGRAAERDEILARRGRRVEAVGGQLRERRAQRVVACGEAVVERQRGVPAGLRVLVL